MANISLNVELPAHSHSFQVQVPESASISDIKSQISRSCPGEPKVDGQRLIYAGRLLRDDESIQDIWPVSSLHTTLAPSLGGIPVTDQWLTSSRVLNIPEPFIWPCIRQLGRLVRQRDVLHRSNLFLRPSHLHPFLPHPTSHRFTRNILIGNCISLPSMSGPSEFSPLTLRNKSRYSTSMASTPISKRQNLSCSIVAGPGPPFSMSPFLPLLPASSTNELRKSE